MLLSIVVSKVQGCIQNCFMYKNSFFVNKLHRINKYINTCLYTPYNCYKSLYNLHPVRIVPAQPSQWVWTPSPTHHWSLWPQQSQTLPQWRPVGRWTWWGCGQTSLSSDHPPRPHSWSHSGSLDQRFIPAGKCPPNITWLHANTHHIHY